MSCWTHITACLSVETKFITKKPQLLKQVKKYLENAPKITGSETNADVFVNVQKGYNFWSDKGNFQTRVTISVQGDLRDRNKSQTLKEFNEFLEYVGGLGHIRDYSININHEP